IRMKRAGALLVADDPFLNSQSGLIAGLALRDKLASVLPVVRGVEDGGLIGYVNDVRHRYRSSAEYVHRILQGAKAGELPIVQPLKFELVLNLQTAAALGIEIPQTVRIRADRVIE
ncbi:MAG: ABC transporter substrate binding protein, partial [Burkholderiales bacterium]